ncbi:fumarylacetoacetate hydrolase family protein [Falsirhodobacter sp. 20TX0035]|uniref:fumarylacetoacetate hydrolase family protein n=1 Tax=Falsirhodobacter sp. 20TX0035 TaxID=3022019 RepID=UPI00232B5F18|nr:fumarylacetoacetate hydrolase family protein [Falsirhodobacter sp. 20TX0035]MDB6454160.1 fumarylacetoacetate hydrolase family protein [Falsirhodobacter sp. 20TX0035]
MKLLRYGEAGAERPALLHTDGTMRDLSAHVPDIDAATLPDLDRLRAVDPDSLPKIDGTPRIGPCIARVGNFIAVGLNYADHARESGMAIPAEPILFNKAPSSLSGPNDPIRIPKGSTKLDWEVEIAIVIGQPLHAVTEAEALNGIAGYCICHDVSERGWQQERGGQWTKGKSAPGFGPLGPWLVTPDEIADVQALGLSLDVNGERMQTGSTATMIFPVAHLVSYCSTFMRLEPGDVITTGTPPGVGMGMTPQRFLKAGDVVHLAIDGLGRQRQTVVAHG